MNFRGCSHWVLAAACALLTAGCRSFSPGFLRGGSAARESDAKRQAEALAYFGSGVLRDSALDPAAEQDYRRAVELCPEAAAPAMRLAAWLVKSGRNAEALAVLEEAVKHNPALYELRLGMGQILSVSKDFEKAEQTFREAVSLAPDRNEAYLQLAGLLIAQGREEEVLGLLTAAAETVASPLQILRAVAELYMRRIDFTKPPAGSEPLLKAIEYYERVVRDSHDAGHLADLERLGDLYSVNMQFDKAVAVYEEAISSQPDNMELRKKKARCFLAAGDKDSAVAELERIMQRNPMLLEAQYGLGELYESMGDIQHAADCYHAVMELDPKNPLPYMRLALLETEFSIDNAIETIEYGLQNIPGNVNLLDFLAYLYGQKGDFASAMGVYEVMRSALLEAGAAEDALPQSFYMNFGNAAEKADVPAKAVALFQQAIDADPSALEPYVRLAFVLYNAGKVEQALETMKSAVEVHKGTAQEFLARVFLGMLYNHAGRSEDAVETFALAEQLSEKKDWEPPASVKAMFYFNYGAACERLKRYEDAVERLLMAIELDRNHAEAYNYVAYMWAERNENLEKALEFVKKALELEPDNGAFVDTLGWVLYRKGNYAAALEQIKRANELIPDDPTILEHLGDIYFALGDKDKAREHWARSLEKEMNESVRQKLTDLDK